MSADTIVAIATAAGAGGVGIVRLSGPEAPRIAEAIGGRLPPPGRLRHARFRDADGQVLDDGLLLRFAAPASFTGEDVVELQGHGSPVVLAALVGRCRALGARAARPGEFSERAFLNGKLDLAQAEAVADLIAASSLAAARAARRSLDGEFSRRVHGLAEALTALRVWIEAAIDFPEEEIDFLADRQLLDRHDALERAFAALLREAEHGRRLIDGAYVLIAGAPNAGKSSLLNALAGAERAIVTDVAGTTRDLLREEVAVDGLTLTLVDTAGLRASQDRVEREGIRRARAELARADLVLAVVDCRDPGGVQALRAELPAGVRTLWVHAKADLGGQAAPAPAPAGEVHLRVSARTGEGLAGLREALRAQLSTEEEPGGSFSARARHLEALSDAAERVRLGGTLLRSGQGELAAEELRLAQDALGTLTGRVGSDALLGRVFSSFCIGK